METEVQEIKPLSKVVSQQGPILKYRSLSVWIQTLCSQQHKYAFVPTGLSWKLVPWGITWGGLKHVSMRFYVEYDTGSRQRGQNTKDGGQENKMPLKIWQKLGLLQSMALRDSRQFNSDHKGYRNPNSIWVTWGWDDTILSGFTGSHPPVCSGWWLFDHVPS